MWNIFVTYVIPIVMLIAAVVGMLRDWSGREFGPRFYEFLASHPRSKLAVPGFVGLLVGVALCASTVRALTASSVPPVTAKTRIVLLLPTGDVVRSAYQDGERQLQGMSQFINETDGRYTDDFEFVPINSAMDYGVARAIVIKELGRGTRYFIST